MKIFPKIPKVKKSTFFNFSSILTFFRNLARLSSALSFNYLEILKERRSSFVNYMKKIDIAPLFGTSVPKLFPILLVLLSLCHLFNIGERLLALFGIRFYSMRKEEDEETKEYLREGKKEVYGSADDSIDDVSTIN